MESLRKAALSFSAGCAGGLANSLAVWVFGVLGVTAALGVAIAPPLTAAWLYPRIVWGGLWGFLFVLPICRGNWWLRGAVFSLGPTLVQLLIVFPLKAGKGYFGMELGTLTAVFVVIFNLVWGLTASWLMMSMERERN